MSDDSFYRMDVALWQVAARVRNSDLPADDWHNFRDLIKAASALLRPHDPNQTAIVDEDSDEFGAVIDAHLAIGTEGGRE